MIAFSFSGKLCHDPVAAAQSLTALGLPIPADLSRCNGISIPLGEAAARGFLLLLRKDLDALDLNSTAHTLEIDDDLGHVVTLHNLVISKEPLCLSYNFDADPKALYLVEVADSRWLCRNPYFTTALNKQYNVRAPGWDGAYYDSSRNSGSDWTWATLVEDIWNTMSAQLGTFPGLPATPNGVPEGFVFPGVSAWQALNHVLYGLGFAVKPTLTAASNQYSIIRVGDADAATDAVITAAESAYRKIWDADYLSVSRGRVPANVRVFFHRVETYGTEDTTGKTSTQWQSNAVYSVDVAGDSNGAAVYHPVWDDMPAVYDTSGSLTNSSALNARAAEVAARWLAQVNGAGGGRLHKIFSGLLAVYPGSTLRGVAWRQDAQGGVITEIVRHPYRMLGVDDRGQWCEIEQESSREKPPDLGPTHPNYPHLLQVVQIENGTPTSSRYDASVQRLPTAPSTWADKESVWAIDLAGATTLEAGQRYHGRLVNYASGRPVYSIDSGAGRCAPPASETVPADNPIRCEDGDLNYYARQKTWSYTSGGCLTFAYGPEFLAYKIACCEQDSCGSGGFGPPPPPTSYCCETLDSTVTFRLVSDGFPFCVPDPTDVVFTGDWDATVMGYRVDYDGDGWSIHGYVSCLQLGDDDGSSCFNQGGYTPYSWHWGFTGALACPDPDVPAIAFQPCWYSNQHPANESCDPLAGRIYLYFSEHLYLEFNGVATGESWYCLADTEASQDCYELTASELTTMLGDGYTLVSGPHDNEADCLADCTGGGGGTIESFGLGTATSTMSASVSKTSVTTSDGDLLIVLLSVYDTDGTAVSALTYDGVAMTAGASQSIAGLHAFAYYLPITTGVTATVSVTMNSVADGMIVQVVRVAGLVSNTLDRSATDADNNGSPSSGATLTTTAANEYLQGFVAFNGASVFTGTWLNSFTDGGQEVQLSTFLAASEGYNIVSATGAYTAEKASASSGLWSAIILTFK